MAHISELAGSAESLAATEISGVVLERVKLTSDLPEAQGMSGEL
ncbi:hypothetical protein [Candidatus Thiodiazotropha endoloripes]|nr:hypothetical protein [Candidatus Thiodiazotropha endoloripes]MCW4184366.1 hypothetical protein [Candidatus Thiodiazotropha weberae]MCW4190537.1 hypothetical protein [Candidatus Thiodiazotropha weberae]MCW4222038.1 hypothetical protein [Candidatus Thiodiazotropha lotti]